MNGQLLTPREQEVLRLVRDGFTTRDIAKRLHRSFNTIAMHRRHILRKLGVTTTAQALVVAQEQAVLEEIQDGIENNAARGG
jgi:DNA-binding NarL/FixJ family response regulator